MHIRANVSARAHIYRWYLVATSSHTVTICRYWFVGHSIMYLLLGLYFGHSALERLVPRVTKQEKTAALFEELNISRESVLLGKIY